MPTFSRRRLFGTATYIRPIPVLPPGTHEGNFGIDAVLLRTASPSFTVNAVVFRNQTPTGPKLDAVILRTQTPTGGFKLDAIKGKTFSPTTTVDADIKQFDRPGSLTAGAWIAGKFTLGAWLAGRFGLDAFIMASGAGFFNLDADIKQFGRPGSPFTVSAIVGRTYTPSLTVNAVILRTSSPSTMANAVIGRTYTPTTTINAVIQKGYTNPFTVDAVKLKTFSPSFTASAVVFANPSSSKTLDADIKQFGRPGSPFVLDSLVKKTNNLGSFGVAAYKVKTITVAAGKDNFFAVPGGLYRYQPDSYPPVDTPIEEYYGPGHYGGWETRIFSPSDVGANPFYPFARAGSYLSSSVDPVQPYTIYGIWGQYYDHTFTNLYSYGCWITYIIFNTSILPLGLTINEVSFSTGYCPNNDYRGSPPWENATVIGQSQLRSFDWGGDPVRSPTDFVSGSVQHDFTLAATMEESQLTQDNTAGYLEWTATANLDNVITWPYTSFFITTDQMEGGTAPAYDLGSNPKKLGSATTSVWGQAFDRFSDPRCEWSDPPPKLYLDWTIGSPKSIYAWIAKRVESGKYLNAVIKKTITVPGVKGTDEDPNRHGTIDARIFGSVEASTTVNAIVRKTQAPTTTLAAILGKTQSGSLNVGAFVLGYMRLDAWIATNAEERFGYLTLDAVVQKTMPPGSFAVNAVVTRPAGGGFGVAALVLAARPGSFAVNAVIIGPRPGGMAVDAVTLSPGRPGSFTVSAWLLKTFEGPTTVDAVIHRSRAGSFPLQAVKARTSSRASTLDAEVAPLNFGLNALIRVVQRDLFTINAILSPRLSFGLDALIRPRVALDAVIRRTSSSSFGVAAHIVTAIPGTRVWMGHVDAAVLRPRPGSFGLSAYVLHVDIASSGESTIDAWVTGPYASSFGLDAIIIGLTKSSSFMLAADIKGPGERRGLAQVSAVVRRGRGDLFSLAAEILDHPFFTLNAFIAGHIGLDAVIVRPAPHSFSLAAVIAGLRHLDAVIKRTQAASTGLSAIVSTATGAYPGHQGSSSLNAMVSGSRSHGMTLDAQISVPRSFGLSAFINPHFGLSAWIVTESGGDGRFGLDAYIRAANIVIYPPGGGDPTDEGGDPIPPGFRTGRRYRVKITVAGSDITGDVVWAETEFVQQARTGPGTFTITLHGMYSFDGGEEVILTIDDWRVFGGYVMSIDQDYFFEAAPEARTVLRGADYNILFDRLVVYNKPYTTASGKRLGPYENWKPFAQETMDSVIIKKVFGDYVDLPAGFDYQTYVDTIDTAAPETPWTMPQAGSPVRQVMQSITQVTNGIFYIDPYLALHYHSRRDVTAPYPITDGEGGISSQQIDLSTDISKMVTDDRLWGTLAKRVSGDLMITHHAANVDEYGLWQYGEWRSEIHHANWLSRRAGSIISRYSVPIQKAKVTIFEPGYQAGQVATVTLNEYGVDADLVIREMKISFAVSKGPDPDNANAFYAVPRYDLTIGLDPEEPWNIYDFLPFEGWNVGQDEKHVGHRKFWGTNELDIYAITWETFDNRTAGPAPWPRESYGLGGYGLPPDIYSWGLTSSWDYYDWEWWFGSYWYLWLAAEHMNAWVANGEAVLQSGHYSKSAFSMLGPYGGFSIQPWAMHVGAPAGSGGWRGNDQIGHQDFEVEILYSFDNVKPDERENSWGQGMVLEVIPNGIVNVDGNLESSPNAWVIFPNQGTPGELDDERPGHSTGSMGTPGGKWHAKWAVGGRPGSGFGPGKYGDQYWYNKYKLWRDGTPEPLEWCDYNLTGYPEEWLRHDEARPINEETFDESEVSIWPHPYTITGHMGEAPNYAFRVGLYSQQPEQNLVPEFWVPPHDQEWIDNVGLIDVEDYPPAILRIDWIRFQNETPGYTLGGYVTEGWGAEIVRTEHGTFETTGMPSRSTLSVFDTDTGELLEPASQWDYDPDQPDGMHFVLKGGVNPQFVTCAYRVTPNTVRTAVYTTRVNVQNVVHDRQRLLDIHGV